MADSDHNQRRSVLMTADAVGGVWTWALDLVRSLAPHRIDFVIAVMGGGMNDDQRAAAQSCENLRVIEGDFRLEWMQDPWHDVAQAGQWLLDLAAEVRPDIVHLNGYAHASLPWRAPVVVMAHSCVLSWWKAVKGVSAPPEYDRYAETVRTGLRAADLVAAPSRGMLACLTQHYGHLRNARVIPNGRDPALYRSRPKEPFVFSAGRLWDEAKNIGALQAIAGGLGWPVLLAGDDKHPDGSRRPLAGLHTLGRLSPQELAAWFSRASIYALPARYEPFGLSVLEAALSGCALVLGDIPSLRENWQGAAVFVHPDDTRELRAALDLLIRSEELRHNLAERARERAASFSLEKMAAAWMDAYNNLLVGRELVSCA